MKQPTKEELKMELYHVQRLLEDMTNKYNEVVMQYRQLEQMYIQLRDSKED